MYEITSESTIGELQSLPGFNRFPQFLMFSELHPESSRKNNSLKKYHQLFPSWNVESMVKGLKRLQELIEKGVRVDYDIWTEQEREEKSDKTKTKMFYFPGDEGKPFVLICAGGGYEVVCSFAEAFPTAAKFNEMGYNAFVLSYRVYQEDIFPKPVDDLARAISFIMEHADEFKVSKEHYAVAGFSAGGHLAALWGTDKMGYKNYCLPKPEILMLAYPVIDVSIIPDEKQKKSIMKMMVGENPTSEKLKSLNVSCNIGSDYPPFYIWQCEDDPISIQNSIQMVESAKKAGISYKFFSVPEGGHGLGVGVGTLAESWLEEAVDYWKKIIKLKL